MPAPEDQRPAEPLDLESLIAFALTQPEPERNSAIERFCRAHPSEDPAALREAVAAEVALHTQTTGEARVTSPDPARHLEHLKSLSPPPGRYQLQGEVARGGMGAILRVRDQALGRTLAMKVILGQAEAGTGTTPPVDASVLARFLDEAQVTGQLDHPGVVPVHELGLDAGGRVYFTMRLIKGRTADEVFLLARERKEGWTLTRALEVLLKVCDTVAYAHQKGVIHRDLKPANVMVGRFGEVYVMDWGLARVLGTPDRRDLRIRHPDTTSHVQTERSREAASDSPIMTMDGTVVGTPSYMPPEQAAGKIEELGPRSDVYAVGAMLYALLTGRQPYVQPGTAMSPYTILGLVLHGPPAPIREIDRTAPAELVAICEKAMAREQNQRYPDTRELADDLRAWLDGRVVRAHRTGFWVSLRKWVRRNRTAALLTAAMLATGITAHVRVVAERDLAVANLCDSIEQSAIARQRASELEPLAELRSLDLLAERFPSPASLAAGTREDLAEFMTSAGQVLQRLAHRERELAILSARRIPKPHPADQRLRELRGHLDVHDAGRRPAGESFATPESERAHVTELREEIAALQSRIEAEREHDFGWDHPAAFQFDTLRRLVARLRALRVPDPDGVTIAGLGTRLGVFHGAPEDLAMDASRWLDGMGEVWSRQTSLPLPEPPETYMYRFESSVPAKVLLRGRHVGSTPTSLTLEQLSGHFDPELRDALSSTEATAALKERFLGPFSGGSSGSTSAGESGISVTSKRQDGEHLLLLRAYARNQKITLTAGGLQLRVVTDNGTPLDECRIECRREGREAVYTLHFSER